MKQPKYSYHEILLKLFPIKIFQVVVIYFFFKFLHWPKKKKKKKIKCFDLLCLQVAENPVIVLAMYQESTSLNVSA